MKRLFARTFCGNDADDYAQCEFVALELSDALLRTILARRKLFVEAKRQDAELCALHFWDTTAEYVSGDDVMLTEAQENHLFGGDGFFDLLEADVAQLNAVDRQEVEIEQMVVDEAEVYWRCFPKHSNVTITTAPISLALIEQWIGAAS